MPSSGPISRFFQPPQTTVSLTELARPEESPASHGPHYRSQDFKTSYLDNARPIVGREHERHLLGGLVKSLKVRGGAVVIPRVHEANILRDHGPL